MLNAQIRKAVQSDLAEVHRLMASFALFQKTPEKFTITLEALEQDGELFNCYIAVVDGKIVGVTTYFFAYYSWIGKALYIDDLFVAEAYRGMGIGNQLFDVLVAIARTEKCKKMRWQVSSWNDKAIRFYKNKGAEIDEIEVNCDLMLN